MKGYKHLTEEDRRRILDSYRRTLCTRDTAKETGFPLRRVQAAVKHAGIVPSRSKGGRCYQRRSDVERWAAEGVSLSEIARRIGTNHHRVADFLAKHDFHRTPFVQVGANNPAWNGGRMTDKSGYILIHRPDHPEANRHGYVREHRLVMELVFGRPLLRSEVVHHRDDDRSNNDPANLEVFPTNGEHLAETRKGRIPGWSEEGRSKVLEACRKGRESPRRTSRRASSAGDPP